MWCVEVSVLLRHIDVDSRVTFCELGIDCDFGKVMNRLEEGGAVGKEGVYLPREVQCCQSFRNGARGPSS